MAKTDHDIAESVLAGGNLPSGYALDFTLTPPIRKVTIDERRAAETATADEETASKSRAAILKRTDAVVANDPPVVP